jgi:DNA-binding NarL/FixJ family response regulator
VWNSRYLQPSQGEQKYIERPSTMKINIVIADDHDLVGKSVAALLTSIPDFEVVGQCENGRDLIELVERLRPNVAIVDLGMPRMNGVEVARRLRQTNRSTRVIILSG